MHRDDIEAATRPRTLSQFVYQVLATAHPQPFGAGDVIARLPFSEASIYEAMRYLRELGVIRYVQGSRRLHELVPGIPMPHDRRGGSRLRRVAARPISQITAARIRKPR